VWRMFFRRVEGVNLFEGGSFLDTLPTEFS
jgi:hypothetical protein